MNKHRRGGGLKILGVPVTVIAIKDRVTGHDPLAALYLSGSYYSRLMSRETNNQT